MRSILLSTPRLRSRTWMTSRELRTEPVYNLSVVGQGQPSSCLKCCEKRTRLVHSRATKRAGIGLRRGRRRRAGIERYLVEARRYPQIARRHVSRDDETDAHLVD